MRRLLQSEFSANFHFLQEKDSAYISGKLLSAIKYMHDHGIVLTRGRESAIPSRHATGPTPQSLGTRVVSAREGATKAYRDVFTASLGRRDWGAGLAPIATRFRTGSAG